MSNFWNGKRRWVALAALLAGFVVMLRTPPVIPVIQLPGEKYPEGYTLPLLGLHVTNTFVGSVVVWILLLLLVFYINRRRPKSSAEVPPDGFYNMFEALFEGLHGFIGNVAGGPYFPLIFKIFMTIFLLVLLSNWTELIPSIDSVGFIEPHTKAVFDQATGEYVRQPGEGYEIYKTFFGGWALNGQCSWIGAEAEQTADETALANARTAAAKVLADAADVAARERLADAEHSAEETAVTSAESNPEADAKAAYDNKLVDRDAQKAGRVDKKCYSGIRAVIWPDYTDTSGTISYAQHEETATATEPAETAETAAAAEAAPVETGVPAHPKPGSEEAKQVPWVVLPFWRAPSTDLNMTLSLALIAFVMIQFIGFRAQRFGYVTKFFNFGTLLKSPLGGIDVVVGLLELIGEFAKILSFSFRLLGNIFAGSILLFVMSFLVPFLPWPFFLLEFFVGVIQAVVFGLLTAIFMNLATIGHHSEKHGEEHAH